MKPLAVAVSVAAAEAAAEAEAKEEGVEVEETPREEARGDCVETDRRTDVISSGHEYSFWEKGKSEQTVSVSQGR